MHLKQFDTVALCNGHGSDVYDLFDIWNALFWNGLNET